MRKKHRFHVFRKIVLLILFISIEISPKWSPLPSASALPNDTTEPCDLALATEVNDRSIVKKIDDLHVLVNQICPGLIFVTETWLSNVFDHSILELNSHTEFRRGRSMSTDPHGGVVLVVHTTLNPILVSSVSNSEVLFCASFVILCKFRLCLCYRPPLNSAEQYLNFINALKQH